MVVDFHTHIFPDKIAAKTVAMLGKRCGQTPFTDGTLNGLLKQMEDGNVDISVIQPVVTNPEQFKTINESACYINEKFKDKIISFGGIHPDSSNYKDELRMIKSMGLKGIKLHPDYQDTFIDDMKYMHIIDYASQLGLVTLVHAGVDVGIPSPVHCSPKAARSMVDQVHPEKLVMAHLGGCDLWEDVVKFLAGTDIYLDTAVIYGRITNEQFLKIVKTHGTDKILFATDSPWCDQKDSIEWLKNQPLSDDELNSIYSANAVKLLGI